MSETPEQLRERMSRAGKGRLRTMSPGKRTHLAYVAGVKGGAPRQYDHDEVRRLKAAGKKAEEIAAELGMSVPSVYRILAKARQR
jgi:DNA invertase Pin-like site-specific DNA recombinase